MPSSVTFGVGDTVGTFALSAVGDTDNDDGEYVELGFGTLRGGVSEWNRSTTAAVLRDNDGTPPGAVQDLAATPGDRRVTLAWRRPASDGGSVITGYAYRYRLQGGTFEDWTDTGSTDTAAAVAGLENGETYVVQVRVRNAHRSGPSAETTSTAGTRRSGICGRTYGVQQSILARARQSNCRRPVPRLNRSSDALSWIASAKCTWSWARALQRASRVRWWVSVMGSSLGDVWRVSAIRCRKRARKARDAPEATPQSGVDALLPDRPSRQRGAVDPRRVEGAASRRPLRRRAETGLAGGRVGLGPSGTVAA